MILKKKKKEWNNLFCLGGLKQLNTEKLLFENKIVFICCNKARTQHKIPPKSLASPCI